jgi:GNAT superfamily N-acetyltransferase
VAHPSDSQEQRRAEALILQAVSTSVGVELAPRSLRLDGGARAGVDGAAPDESVLVEVFAHQGRLKGAHCHKVARDALKQPHERFNGTRMSIPGYLIARLALSQALHGQGLGTHLLLDALERLDAAATNA